MSLSEKHKLLRSVDVAAFVDCGCKVYVWNDSSGVEIEYCPMHEAAPEMLKALKGIVDVLYAGPTEATNADFTNAVDIAIQAIAQAEGGE